LWHWHHKHPVEFSKNNHTHHNPHNRGATAGATPPCYPTQYIPSSPCSPAFDVPCPGQARTRAEINSTSTLEDLGRPSIATLSPRISVRFPASCPHYPTHTHIPNELRSVGTGARAGKEEVTPTHS